MSAGEAARQQALMHALALATPLPVEGLRPLPGPGGGAGPEAGWQAYRRNALATAWRALAAAYPTLQRALGDQAMRALARDLWLAHPPVRGDLACWGAELPALLAGHPASAQRLWLPDLARLDWAVHLAAAAADASAEVAGLALLGERDPHDLQLVWAPGCAWLESPWPVATGWNAQEQGAEAFAAALQALEAGPPQGVWVQRRGWTVQVLPVNDAVVARFNRRLWQGATLGSALDEVLAGPAAGAAAFDFQAWLIHTLRAGRLAAVRVSPGG